ncbi:MAG: hypothetical protein BWY63_01176 [Chloroflexi bacterium ADurb.Bin360]|nr:MAG: hypothetical protein BWY63_01176 [Chloroflexi bacterium ADurb.Bin360]
MGRYDRIVVQIAIRVGRLVPAEVQTPYLDTGIGFVGVTIPIAFAAVPGPRTEHVNLMAALNEGLRQVEGVVLSA